MQEKRAVQSRLMLWDMAIGESERLVRLAKRANAAINSEEVKKKLERENEAFAQFLKNKTDYVEGTGLKQSDLMRFDSLYEKEYGGFTDISATVRACQMLAVILFCQVLKGGKGDGGNVVKNDDKFVEKYLGELLELTCTSKEEVALWRKLFLQLETARDKMLGHADASAFEVSHLDWGTSAKLHYKSIENIDFDCFLNLLERLGLAVRIVMSRM